MDVAGWRGDTRDRPLSRAAKTLATPPLTYNIKYDDDDDDDSESALNLFLHFGRRISSATGDDREDQFLYQRLSGTLQRFNVILLHELCGEWAAG